GVLPLDADAALALLDAAAATDEPLRVPVRLDPTAAGTNRRVPAMLRGLVRPTRRPAEAVDPQRPSLRQRLAGLPAAERGRALLDLVRANAASVLGHTGAESVAPRQGFLDAGFDSLTAVELRNVLGEVTGLTLPSTVIFDHPTPEALADHLADQLGLDESAGSVPTGSAGSASAGVAEPVPGGRDPLAELDRLESVLSAVRDDEVRQRITDRLETLLSVWRETGATMTGDHEVESATDEELFALIDQEFGPS
ncbi:MAG TPA: phosphopantetheine-binding protein, partial [Micromonospora sp.]